MICPERKKEGLKSKVTIGVMSGTLAYCPPFYDEDGKRHNHDRNLTTTPYSCTRGHMWVNKTTGSCWCGWPENDE